MKVFSDDKIYKVSMFALRIVNYWLIKSSPLRGGAYWLEIVSADQKGRLFSIDKRRPEEYNASGLEYK